MRPYISVTSRDTGNEELVPVDDIVEVNARSDVSGSEIKVAVPGGFKSLIVEETRADLLAASGGYLIEVTKRDSAYNYLLGTFAIQKVGIDIKDPQLRAYILLEDPLSRKRYIEETLADIKAMVDEIVAQNPAGGDFDNTLSNIVYVVNGTSYPIGTSLTVLYSEVLDQLNSVPYFRGKFTNIITLAAGVSDPKKDDLAYIEDTDLIIGGLAGVGGLVRFDGAASWTLLILSSDVGFVGVYASLATLTAGVATPLFGMTAYVSDTAGMAGGSAGNAGHVYYTGAAWAVYSSPVVGGGSVSYSRYTNNGSTIWATSTGVTVVKDDVTGEITVDVPFGVEPKFLAIPFSSGDTDDSNHLYLIIKYTSSRGFNTNHKDINLPHIRIIRSGTPSRSQPLDVVGGGNNTNDKKYGVSAVGGGDGSDLEIKISNAPVASSNVLFVTFPNV